MYLTEIYGIFQPDLRPNDPVTGIWRGAWCETWDPHSNNLHNHDFRTVLSFYWLVESFSILKNQIRTILKTFGKLATKILPIRTDFWRTPAPQLPNPITVTMLSTACCVIFVTGSVRLTNDQWSFNISHFTSFLLWQIDPAKGWRCQFEVISFSGN